MIYFQYVLMGIAIFIVQFTIIGLISIQGFKPDLLLILLVVIGLREKQITGTITGFMIGLVQDAISGFWGLSSLSKSIAGFIVGYSSIEESVNKQKTFLVNLTIASLINNFIYFFVFVRGGNISFWQIVFYHAIPTTIYTIIIGAAIVLIFSKIFRTAQ